MEIFLLVRRYKSSSLLHMGYKISEWLHTEAFFFDLNFFIVSTDKTISPRFVRYSEL